MHSSRMRTARSLTINGGLPARGGVPAQGGLPRGSVCPGGCLLRVGYYHPPPRGQTDTCKNITFANYVCGR